MRASIASRPTAISIRRLGSACNCPALNSRASWSVIAATPSSAARRSRTSMPSPERGSTGAGAASDPPRTSPAATSRPTAAWTAATGTSSTSLCCPTGTPGSRNNCWYTRASTADSPTASQSATVRA